MKMLTAMLLVFSGLVSAAEIHPKVAAALDWNLPMNVCEVPPALNGQAIVNADGTQEVSRKLTPTKARKAKRLKKSYDKCVYRYKHDLIKEMGSLKSVAQYGLTQQQADIILGKMKLIQQVVESPMGLPPESATE